MTEELKTLNDIEFDMFGGSDRKSYTKSPPPIIIVASSDELRLEAIKWIKKLESSPNDVKFPRIEILNETYSCGYDYDYISGAIKALKQFFNIDESDLK